MPIMCVILLLPFYNMYEYGVDDVSCCLIGGYHQM